MPAVSIKSPIEGLLSMRPISQIVIMDASAKYHNLCGDRRITVCDMSVMDGNDKNGGPNHLKAWREFRGMTQGELADIVGTNANMIGYLEAGERGLSAKWLRRLAPALGITPGFLLDHDPNTLDNDIIEIWASADDRQKRQISVIAETILKDGTNG